VIWRVVRGTLVIVAAFVVLYSLGIAWDYYERSSGWSLAAYHDRLGRLLIFGGSLTIVAFLLEVLVKAKRKTSK
jgi:hypothetical protein